MIRCAKLLSPTLTRMIPVKITANRKQSIINILWPPIFGVLNPKDLICYFHVLIYIDPGDYI
jgi:hypothetical protein